MDLAERGLPAVGTPASEADPAAYGVLPVDGEFLTAEGDLPNWIPVAHDGIIVGYVDISEILSDEAPDSAPTVVDEQLQRVGTFDASGDYVADR